MQLRYYALEAQSAGVLQHQIALRRDVIAEANRTGGRRIRQKRPKRILPLDQRDFSQIIAIEIKKVEDTIGEAVRAAVAQVGLQYGKIGGPGLTFNNELAVNQRLPDG